MRQLRLRNPSLPKIGLTDLVVLGAAIFFAPKLAELANNLFPERPPGGTTGIPGVPGGPVPSGAAFRLVSFLIEKPFNLLNVLGYPPGTTLTVKWAVEHQGPAGTYVAGCRIKQAVMFGQYLTPEIEAPFAVQAEGSYGRYYVTTTFVTTDWLPGFFSYDVWIRDANGVHLFDKSY